jgi:hypothetical protein
MHGPELRSRRPQHKVSPFTFNPKIDVVLSDLRLPHPKNGRDRYILGQAVAHLLPNTEQILCTIDIVDAAISPCVTLCHILTPILVIKVTIMTRVFDRPARRYAMEGMESIPDLNFLLLI